MHTIFVILKTVRRLLDHMQENTPDKERKDDGKCTEQLMKEKVFNTKPISIELV